jgi:hypothetical protein
MHKTQTIHLYGHIHQTRDIKTFEKYGKMWEKEIGITFKAAIVGRMIDYMDYTPRTLEEIKKSERMGLICRQRNNLKTYKAKH